MVIESTVICLDNSDFMRNEDIQPSRMIAQSEAIELIIQSKLKSHPENHIGLITLSNHAVQTNLTTSEVKLLNEIRKVEIGGSTQLLKGLTLASLLLKHRPFKNHKCRIIAFVGSPVSVLTNDFTAIGKKLKKENISVTLISFGNEEVGKKEMESMMSLMNGSNSASNKYISVPNGESFYNVLAMNGVLERMYGNGGGISMNDDNDDDLRMALEMSLREQGPPSANIDRAPSSIPQPTGIQDGNTLSEDEQLALAIQLSMQDPGVQAAPITPAVPSEMDSTKSVLNNILSVGNDSGIGQPSSTNNNSQLSNDKDPKEEDKKENKPQ